MDIIEEITIRKTIRQFIHEKNVGGLKKWFKEKWVDISRKTKSGGHPACGASAGKKERKGGKAKYPKCVPAAKAASMSSTQKRSAVIRKRKYGSTERGKAKNVPTIPNK
jgi:hypothetical protein